MFPDEGVAGGEIGLGAVAFVPEGAVDAEGFGGFVPVAEAGLVGVEGVFDFGVGGDELVFLFGVGNADHSGEPGGAGSGEVGDAAWAAFFVAEDFVLNGERGLGGWEWVERGGGGGGMEDAEGVVGEGGVSPEPEEAVVVAGEEDGVAAEDAGFGGWGGDAELFAFGEAACAGEAADALGDGEAVDFDAMGGVGFRGDADSAEAEAVGFEFVAVAGEVEVDFLVLEFRGVDGGESVVVGDEEEVVGGAEFDHGDGLSVRAIDDLDAEWGGVEGGERDEEGEGAHVVVGGQGEGR